MCVHYIKISFPQSIETEVKSQKQIPLTRKNGIFLIPLTFILNLIFMHITFKSYKFSYSFI